MANDKFELSLEAMGINLPYSIEAEQAVLGAVIVDYKVIDEITGLLLPEYFYSKQNAAIFREMMLMYGTGKPVDFVTVLDSVSAAGVFSSEEDTKVYLYNVTETVPTVSNVVTYAKIIYEKYLTRTLIKSCKEIIDNSADGQETAATLLDFAEQKIFEIRNGRDSSEIWKIDSVLLEVIDRLDKMSGPDREKYLGLPTGFPILDKTLTGLNRSDLIILAARPGVGKTSFALNIATNVTMKRPDISIAIFSLEMTKQQLAQRMLSSISGVESFVFRSGEVRTDQWSDIAEAASQLSKTQIFIDDTSGISVSEIKSKSRRLKDLGLVIVDYLQLMSGGKRNDSRVNEISEITRSFKIMAKELNVPVILLSQLSRDSEKQQRRPKLSDLRDSGSIEQDADIVLFLHREGDPNEADMEEINDVSLIVAKNRHGETTRIDMHWDGKLTRFTVMDVSRDDD
ncbi:MAG: replicative DNA helicase [Oscillospiraceae bacterium]